MSGIKELDENTALIKQSIKNKIPQFNQKNLLAMHVYMAR